MSARTAILTGRAIPFLKPYWGMQEWRLVSSVLAGRRLTGQRERLETVIEEVTGLQHASALISGRAAIRLALEAFALPPSSEVVAPSYCCGAVADAILAAGHRPLLVDIDETFAPAVDSVVEASDGGNVRALIIPHLFGRWARTTPELLQLARDRDLRVIDDACPLFGLEDPAGTYVGASGDAGTFSMGIGKTLMGPGGGALVTADERLADRCSDLLAGPEPRQAARRRVRRFTIRHGFPRAALLGRTAAGFIRSRLVGQSGSDDGEGSGPEGGSDVELLALRRCSEIEAALANVQVRRTEEILGRRRRNARALLESLASADRDRVLLPEDVPTHAFTKFVVALPGEAGAEIAGRIRRRLWDLGIETESTYTPLHLRARFRDLRRVGLGFTERVWRGTFAVPVRPNLRDAELERIRSGLVAAFRKQGARP